MITIKEYSDKYLHELTDLYNLWDDIDDLTDNEMSQTIKAYEQNTNNKTFLAFNEDEKPIGYIFCGICYYVGAASFLEIIQIMIREEYRGQGIGKMMMDYVADMYFKQGIRQIRLHSRVKLTKAHAFYKKLGFNEFKQSKFFVKNL